MPKNKYSSRMNFLTDTANRSRMAGDLPLELKREWLEATQDMPSNALLAFRSSGGLSKWHLMPVSRVRDGSPGTLCGRGSLKQVISWTESENLEKMDLDSKFGSLCKKCRQLLDTASIKKERGGSETVEQTS